MPAGCFRLNGYKPLPGRRSTPTRHPPSIWTHSTSRPPPAPARRLGFLLTPLCPSQPPTRSLPVNPPCSASDPAPPIFHTGLAAVISHPCPVDCSPIGTRTCNTALSASDPPGEGSHHPQRSHRPQRGQGLTQTCILLLTLFVATPAPFSLPRARQIPASGPLHLLCPLPRTLFSKTSCRSLLKPPC